MEDNGNSYWMDSDSLPQPSPQDLRGRQSVRATFKLSARAIETMSIVSVHLGIKQKSLFDHLIEDAQSLSHIARELESEKFRTLSRIQKTFVISRRTLSCLDEISKQFQAPPRRTGRIFNSAVIAGNCPGKGKTSKTQRNIK